jgi:hypothetical protein
MSLTQRAKHRFYIVITTDLVIYARWFLCTEGDDCIIRMMSCVLAGIKLIQALDQIEQTIDDLVLFRFSSGGYCSRYRPMTGEKNF